MCKEGRMEGTTNGTQATHLGWYCKVIEAFLGPLLGAPPDRTGTGEPSSSHSPGNTVFPGGFPGGEGLRCPHPPYLQIPQQPKGPLPPFHTKEFNSSSSQASRQASRIPEIPEFLRSPLRPHFLKGLTLSSSNIAIQESGGVGKTG